RVIYDKFVRPAMVDLDKVGLHYAVSSVFENGSQSGRIYSYTVDCGDYRVLTAGKARLGLGRARITSEITLDSTELTFGVAYLGDHNVSGGVRRFVCEEAYEAAMQEITQAFRQADFAQFIRVVDREFGPGTYSLALLFRDERRKVLRQILESSLGDAEAAYRQIYQNHVSLMRFLASIGMPAPKGLEMAAEVTLNTDLKRAFEEINLDLGRIAALVDEAQVAKVPFDEPTLEFALRKTLERLAERLAAAPQSREALEMLDAATAVARSLPFEVALWRVQNIYHHLLMTVYQERESEGGAESQAWVQTFRALGAKLSVRVD
ncbi:MAG TPA: DUF3536 domain-containing protein, partial [Bryobacteraceae bacterium]